VSTTVAGNAARKKIVVNQRLTHKGQSDRGPKGNRITSGEHELRPRGRSRREWGSVRPEGGQKKDLSDRQS